MARFNPYVESSIESIAELLTDFSEISISQNKSVVFDPHAVVQIAQRLREIGHEHRMTAELLLSCQNADTVAEQADRIALLERQVQGFRRTISSRNRHVNRLRSALDDARKDPEPKPLKVVRINNQADLDAFAKSSRGDEITILPEDGSREIWWPEKIKGSWMWPDGSVVVQQISEKPCFGAWSPDGQILNDDKPGKPAWFDTKEQAAEGLMRLKCGPWHPKPEEPCEALELPKPIDVPEAGSAAPLCSNAPLYDQVMMKAGVFQRIPPSAGYTIGPFLTPNGQVVSVDTTAPVTGTCPASPCAKTGCVTDVPAPSCKVEISNYTATITAPDEESFACPQCNKRDSLDGFDSIGACNDNIFCTDYHCEFDPRNGQIHQCGKTMEEASAARERGEWCGTVRAEKPDRPEGSLELPPPIQVIEPDPADVIRVGAFLVLSLAIITLAIVAGSWLAG